MKCNKCGFVVINLGTETEPAQKRVGPDQDGMFYRVDCSVEDCQQKNYFDQRYHGKEKTSDSN